MALELVSGADFLVQIDVRGSDSAGNPGKTWPKISSQTAFRNPGMAFHRKIENGHETA